MAILNPDSSGSRLINFTLEPFVLKPSALHLIQIQAAIDDLS